MAWGVIPGPCLFHDKGMHFSALSAGYAVPQADFDAVVHSVFPAAVNLRPDGQSLLLTLVASGEADLPQGLRLDTPPGFSFERLNAGSIVHSRAGTLVIDHADLAIDYRRARRWLSDLPALNTDITNPPAAQAWRYTWNILNNRQRQVNADIRADDVIHPDREPKSPLSKRLGETIRDLVDAARRYQSNFVVPVERLIGLGAGLTPCGDDFLVGYLAGLWCTIRDSPTHRQITSDLSQAVIELLPRTNDISRTYLFHATQGQVSSRLFYLAEAISRGVKGNQLLSLAESAMKSGHTSGMDAVSGLLLGFATMEGAILKG